MTSKSQFNYTSPKSQSQLSLPTFAVPASPRKLRKFQSHQSLSSASFSSVPQPRPQPQPSTTGARAPPDDLSQNIASLDSSRPRLRRARSNSDTGASNLTPVTTQKLPARKAGSSGYSIKRSNLESLFRDGPTTGKIMEGLQEMRYLVLSTRVDADGDGMVSERLVLVLLSWICLKTVMLIPPTHSLHIEYTCGWSSLISLPCQQMNISP
jgi:cell cycle arrest protein BUB2